MGEYIMPNWELYSREAQLYVDIEAHEDGVRGWSVPRGYATGLASIEPPALRLGDALSALGVFSPEGLRAVTETWKQVDFADVQEFGDSRRLTQELIGRLDRAQLFTARATQDHVNTVYNCWQLPMYRFDFRLSPSPLRNCKENRTTFFPTKSAGDQILSGALLRFD